MVEPQKPLPDQEAIRAENADGDPGAGLPRSAGDGSAWPRRKVLKALSLAGAGAAVFGRALEAVAAGAPKVTPEMVRQAEWIAGITLSDEQRRLMLEDLDKTLADYTAMRAVPLDNDVPPALRFAPWPPDEPPLPGPRGIVEMTESAAPGPPASMDELAFAPVTELAAHIRKRQISPLELTSVYIDRLRRFDPVLHCLINETEELAVDLARQAEREIAAGLYRGPLHGIPWGAKDLLAVPGYRTTWGAGPYRDQMRSEKATPVARLEEAGAVLIAKLAVGELAWGDVWYGGMTRNPWKTDQGSSGSSAGSAAAVAAGLVGFALGTETWGSIVSPCTRCGATGLRPTFGRVSRYGAMALSWSMDKIGPIARSAEDCALVFGAIHGPDGLDPTVADLPFYWPLRRDPRTLRVGYVRSLFEEDYTKWAETDAEKPGLAEWQEIDKGTLAAFVHLGFRLVPIDLPRDLPIQPLSVILTAEASAAFDGLTRQGRLGELARQVRDAWPNIFRQGELVPAVEYLRANRIRTLLMRQMEEKLEGIDVYLVPSFGGDNLLLTNLTGHPAVVFPNGFRRSDGTPTSMTIQGRLFGEAEILALAAAFQKKTDFHLRRPPLPSPASRPA